MSGYQPGGRGAYDLQGRVAVVTGGSSGIGAATVRRLAEAGATVAIGYNGGQDRAAALAAELPGRGHLPVFIPMGGSAAIAAGVATVQERLGPADVLVNSAGVTRAVPHAELDALDDATFDRILITDDSPLGRPWWSMADGIFDLQEGRAMTACTAPSPTASCRGR